LIFQRMAEEVLSTCLKTQRKVVLFHWFKAAINLIHSLDLKDQLSAHRKWLQKAYL
jgi:hypothetical protein